ncbi:hypothetical protein FGB62_35g222 [Gracilaria domingensis]|nr:hypothetical protein FGB62_35g222 [Gracilaria domingensis]
MDANLGLKTEEAFAPKRTSSVAVKRARHRLSHFESFELPPSGVSTLPPSVRHVTLDALENSASAQRTPEAALAAHHTPRSRVTAAKINHKSRTFRLSNASKTTNASEPNKTSVARPKPDRAVGHRGRSHQRRHSAPVSGTPNQSTLAMHHRPHNRAHGVMEGQATAAGNKDSRRRNSLPDPAVSSQQIRVSFALAPPVVGGPSFHNPYAMPTISRGGQLRLNHSNMNTLPASATKFNDHGVPNQHFAHGGTHLGQSPDKRVHALPPETILQLSRFPHPSFLSTSNAARDIDDGLPNSAPIAAGFPSARTSNGCAPFSSKSSQKCVPTPIDPFQPSHEWRTSIVQPVCRSFTNGI